MRAAVVIANWKMNKTIRESVESARSLVALMAEVEGVEVILAVPFTALHAVSEVIEGSPVGLAAQDIHWEDQGPYTGEVSVVQARDAGCRYVLVGHSERRQHFGEVNEMVKLAKICMTNKKAYIISCSALFVGGSARDPQTSGSHLPPKIRLPQALPQGKRYWQM